MREIAAHAGALHEDGLSDTADGLGGGRSREKALAIMKDSRIGTYGALALILSIALRAASLAILVETLSAWSSALAFLAAAIFSRTLMVWHWSSLPSARTDGVAASAGTPDADATRVALLLGTGLTAVLGLVALPFHAWFAAGVLAAGCGELLFRLLSPTKLDYRERIWDQAAGSIVVEEAGGRHAPFAPAGPTAKAMCIAAAPGVSAALTALVLG